MQAVILTNVSLPNLCNFRSSERRLHLCHAQ